MQRILKKGGKMTIQKMWNYLVEHQIVTEEELTLVTQINGYNEEAMLGVLYARTGFNDFEQVKGER